MIHARRRIEMPERSAWIGAATYVSGSAGSGRYAAERPAVRPVILIGCSSNPVYDTSSPGVAPTHDPLLEVGAAVAPVLPDLERGQHASPAQVEDSRVAELEQLGDLVRLEDAELRHYVDRGFCGHCKREGTRRGL